MLYEASALWLRNRQLGDNYKTIQPFKMKALYTLGLLTLLLFTSCDDTYRYWDVSHFNIDTTALKDGAFIKLVYSSQAPDDNKDMKYYIHLIVVAQETGDTVNILTFANNNLKQGDENTVFTYFDQNNPISKIMQMNQENKKFKSIDDINNTEAKEISYVARDPKFDYIADNKFPTVIGTIGIFEVPAK